MFLNSVFLKVNYQLDFAFEGVKTGKPPTMAYLPQLQLMVILSSQEMNTK